MRGVLSAFTLVEVLIASMVMAIVLLGIMGTIMQSRRMTESSILQNAALNVVQGYLEQMKSMDYVDLKASIASGTETVVTRMDSDPDDGVNEEVSFTLSNGEAPTTMPAIGTKPTNAVDNKKIIAISTPKVSANDEFELTIWVWVKDLTGTAAGVDQAKSICMIYSYTFVDGGRTRNFRGQIRSIRSVVPTY